MALPHYTTITLEQTTAPCTKVEEVSLKKRLWPLPLLACVIVGCMDVSGIPVELTPVSRESPAVVIKVATDVLVSPPDSFRSRIPGGSAWSLIGSLPQGDVYKPRDTVFMLDARNVHEAYLVLTGGKLAGYYLPAERTYISNSRLVDVPMQ